MRRLPIYFLVDVSESMAGTPIEEVERGMRTIIQELRVDPYALETAFVSIIAFDDQDRLLVGRMSGKEAKEKHVRDAISYGPAFIVNGEPLEVSGTGGGLNPRTVIGQRADGAVLLLAIDGRQTHSLGASFKDCIDVMMEYGAINAANLDGGSSTMMVYKGETVNSCASMYGSRRLPTAIIVE